MQLLGVDWARPLGLVALALPLIVLLLARAPRPPAAATGTIELWRAVAGTRASEGRRARRRVPPRLILIALALAAGALALAGPRSSGAAQRTWRVLVDRSPSMYLPWAGAGAGGESRLERAAASASVALAPGPGDAIEWVASVGGEEEVIAGRELPASWLEPPRAPQAELPWERLDRPGTMWVTDAAPQTAPRRAGLAASGGAAVPGPIASIGTLRLDWDGERIVEAPEPADARRLAIDAEVPALLRELIRIWAKDRSIELAGDPAGASLHVTCARCDTGTPVAATAGRDGWTASGEAAREGALDADPELGALERWLWVDLAGTQTPLVTWVPGRIDVAWRDLPEVAGDPAAFAVSWAELLDAALLPAEGVVALSERLDAVPALVRAPAEPPEPAGWSERTLPPAALLAALAAVLSLAALGLRA